MPYVNNIPVTDRHNRPSVLSRVLLRTFFIDEGAPRSPYAIRSVHIFKETSNTSPNTLLGDDGLLTEEAVMNSLMVFGPANSDGRTEVDNGFDEGTYTGTVRLAPGPDGQDISNLGTSGIYQIGAVEGVGGNPGEFCVVSDGFNGDAVKGVDRFSLGTDEDGNIVFQGGGTEGDFTIGGISFDFD